MASLLLHDDDDDDDDDDDADDDQLNAKQEEQTVLPKGFPWGKGKVHDILFFLEFFLNLRPPYTSTLFTLLSQTIVSGHVLNLIVFKAPQINIIIINLYDETG